MSYKLENTTIFWKLKFYKLKQYQKLMNFGTNIEIRLNKNSENF